MSRRAQGGRRGIRQAVAGIRHSGAAGEEKRRWALLAGEEVDAFGGTEVGRSVAGRSFEGGRDALLFLSPSQVLLIPRGRERTGVGVSNGPEDPSYCFPN